MTLGITALSIKARSIMTFKNKNKENGTLSIMTLSMGVDHYYAECRLSIVSHLLSVTYKPYMLSVIMLSVIMVSGVAPR